MIAWWEGPLIGFDLETTGVDPDTARIVTAAIVVDRRESTPSVYHFLADPGIDIPDEAAAVHGVTTERARAEGKPAAFVVDRVLSLLSVTGIPLVAFNASYDFTVLDREARRHGLEPLAPHPVIDPLVLDKQVDKYRKGRRTLGVMCEHYGVTLENAHTADADALAAVQLARAIAARVPGCPMRAEDLHAAQIGWRAEQSASLQDYFRRKDPTAVVDGTWPVHPHQ